MLIIEAIEGPVGSGNAIAIGSGTSLLHELIVLQSITANPQPSDVLDPTKRRNLSVPVNSPTKIKTYGYGLGLEYPFQAGYFLGGNFTSDHLSDVPDGFITSFNAPNYRANVTLGNYAFGPKRKLGFSIAYKWQDSFFYDSDLANGTVPAFHVVDAQFSYKIPEIKSVVRIGANNLFNQYYVTAMANPSIGGLG